MIPVDTRRKHGDMITKIIDEHGIEYLQEVVSCQVLLAQETMPPVSESFPYPYPAYIAPENHGITSDPDLSLVDFTLNPPRVPDPTWDEPVWDVHDNVDMQSTTRSSVCPDTAYLSPLTPYDSSDSLEAPVSSSVSLSHLSHNNCTSPTRRRTEDLWIDSYQLDS